MGGASVVCFWEAKWGSGEVASWLLYCGKERVLKRRWQINLKDLITFQLLNSMRRVCRKRGNEEKARKERFFLRVGRSPSKGLQW